MELFICKPSELLMSNRPNTGYQCAQCVCIVTLKDVGVPSTAEWMGIRSNDVPVYMRVYVVPDRVFLAHTLNSHQLLSLADCLCIICYRSSCGTHIDRVRLCAPYDQLSLDVVGRLVYPFGRTYECIFMFVSWCLVRVLCTIVYLFNVFSCALAYICVSVCWRCLFLLLAG